MDLTTTAREKLKGTIDPEGKRNRRDPKEHKDEKAPFAKASSYKQNFPSWENGKRDIFIEKAPQYPVYSQPFRGESTAQSKHVNQLDELRRKEALLSESKGLNRAKRISIPTYS